MAPRRQRHSQSGGSARSTKQRPWQVAGVVAAAALILGFAAEAGRSGNLPGFASAQNSQLRTVIEAEAPDLAAVYQARRYAPIWVKGDKVRPEAQELVALIASAGQDGLEPERYGLSHLKQDLTAAATGEPAALARFELDASQAYVSYVSDLHSPAAGEKMIYTDPAAAPRPMARADILLAAAEAPSLSDHFDTVRTMNPVYEGLRKDLARYRAQHRSKTPDANEQLILLNLERARALPANPGRRYIIVDAAAAMLWMYQDGKLVDSMKVIVGKQNEPTPLMAGMIRYAMFNPYWNVPEDLVSEGWAPRVLAQGPQVFTEKNMEALSDWSPNAHVLDPASIDWRAVAAGQYLRVRQKPGAGNMMGNVKFMLPNDLGIYLHDTPNKALFASTERWFSSGCVRLEDAPRLTRWLFGETPNAPTPDYRVDLKEPVPVYITYFTAAPGPSGVTFRRDIYGRDAVSMAALAEQRDLDKAA